MISYAMKVAEKGHTTEMSCKGFKASLMRAPKLRVTEHVHNLPPGDPVPVYPVQALPGCPDKWVREVGSYVCPVMAEWGLWFDWRENDHLNTAVLTSVKGMDPITGQKLEDLSLQKYVERCPIHGCDFLEDRLCEKCGYKWPPQNYVASPNHLWWDGFRTPDGAVRQFFFSEDEAKDIPSLVIGKESTVPAFGFVFYKVTDKWLEEHPPRPNFVRTSGMSFHTKKCFVGPEGPVGAEGSIGVKGLLGAKQYSAVPVNATFACNSNEVKTSSFSDEDNPVNQIMYSRGSPRGESSASSLAAKSTVRRYQADQRPEPEAIKEVSVGRGAKIRQDLEQDPKPLMAWKEKPEAMIRLYFVFPPQFRQIVSNGDIKDLSGSPEGYAEGLPIG